MCVHVRVDTCGSRVHTKNALGGYTESMKLVKLPKINVLQSRSLSLAGQILTKRVWPVETEDI